jgi:uncharacterized membrane protein YsdA (DUF1294 family)
VAWPTSTIALVTGCVALWSAFAFLAARSDKRRSVAGRRRVREADLLVLALAGGSPGLALAMVAFHHKTRKASFLLRFALVLAAQAGLVVWWFGYR